MKLYMPLKAQMIFWMLKKWLVQTDSAANGGSFHQRYIARVKFLLKHVLLSYVMVQIVNTIIEKHKKKKKNRIRWWLITFRVLILFPRTVNTAFPDDWYRRSINDASRLRWVTSLSKLSDYKIQKTNENNTAYCVEIIGGRPEVQRALFVYGIFDTRFGVCLTRFFLGL